MDEHRSFDGSMGEHMVGSGWGPAHFDAGIGWYRVMNSNTPARVRLPTQLEGRVRVEAHLMIVHSLPAFVLRVQGKVVDPTVSPGAPGVIVHAEVDLMPDEPVEVELELLPPQRVAGSDEAADELSVVQVVGIRLVPNRADRRQEPTRRTKTALDFAIVCLARTGSSHLVSLLDSHPDIRCLGELFNPRENLFATSDVDDPREYIAGIVAAVEERVVGCKLVWNWLYTDPRTLELFHDRQLQVIRLRWANVLDSLISTQLAQKSGIYHSTDANATDVEPLKIGIEACIAELDAIDARDRQLDEWCSGLPMLAIEYEDLASPGTLRGIQEFLGVRPTTLHSPLVKRQTRPLAEVVANWPDLVAALEDTRWGNFVHSQRP